MSMREILGNPLRNMLFRLFGVIKEIDTSVYSFTIFRVRIQLPDLAIWESFSYRRVGGSYLKNCQILRRMIGIHGYICWTCDLHFSKDECLYVFNQALVCEVWRIWKSFVSRGKPLWNYMNAGIVHVYERVSSILERVSDIWVSIPLPLCRRSNSNRTWQGWELPHIWKEWIGFSPCVHSYAFSTESRNVLKGSR